MVCYRSALHNTCSSILMSVNLTSTAEPREHLRRRLIFCAATTGGASVDEVPSPLILMT